MKLRDKVSWLLHGRSAFSWRSYTNSRHMSVFSPEYDILIREKLRLITRQSKHPKMKHTFRHMHTHTHSQRENTAYTHNRRYMGNEWKQHCPQNRGLCRGEAWLSCIIALPTRRHIPGHLLYFQASTVPAISRASSISLEKNLGLWLFHFFCYLSF